MNQSGTVATAPPVTDDTAIRLAVAENENKALKEMVAELRASRDDWKAQAERLALPAPAPIREMSWWPWRRRTTA